MQSGVHWQFRHAAWNVQECRDMLSWQLGMAETFDTIQAESWDMYATLRHG